VKVIIILTGILVVISFFFDKKKTFKGIKKGIIMFLKILPTLLSVIITVSVVLYFISDKVLLEYLGEGAGLSSYLAAAIIGSVSLIPGFIAYPLSGILIAKGVSYSVIAVFITTLKMVGILTIPLEAKFFGLKTAIIRNSLAFVGALIVGFLMVFIYHIF